MHYGKPWQEPWKVTLIISACNHAMYSDHVANIAIWLWASSSPQLPLLIHARWLCFLGHHQALKVSTIHPLAALQGMEFLHWTSTSQLASYAECGLTTAQFWTDPHVNMSRIEHIGGTLWITRDDDDDTHWNASHVLKPNLNWSLLIFCRSV